MALKLPLAPAQWNRDYQTRLNQTMEIEDVKNRKLGTDIDVGANHLILKSPNGARWLITVSNAGAVGATAL